MIFLILPLLAVFLNSSAQNYDMECLWCINVVYNAHGYFGDDIANVTNRQFEEYFDRTCFLSRMKSMLSGAVCYQMYRDHPQAVFDDLRNNVNATQTCLDCSFCSPTA